MLKQKITIFRLIVNIVEKLKNMGGLFSHLEPFESRDWVALDHDSDIAHSICDEQDR